jgi:PKD repeat protein
MARLPRIALLLLTALAVVRPVCAGDVRLVGQDSPVRYLSNTADPGLGMTWVYSGFIDTGWNPGRYGVGYEGSPPGASQLLETALPHTASSLYTRAVFVVDDLSRVRALRLGCDYDDGYVAWINGVEVYRSPEIPAGALSWNTLPLSHESSNAAAPNYGTLVDITAAARPLLLKGTNVLSVAVWNQSPSSPDLVLVPELLMTTPVTRGPYLQSGTPTSVVVRWRTVEPSSTRVWYGLAPGERRMSEGSRTETTEHEVTLSGLSPGTTYYYAVGTDTTVYEGDPTYRFTTAPQADDPGPRRIWILGDSGTASSGARAVRDAYAGFTGATPTDFWMMLGDNAYNDGADDEYQAAVFDMYPLMLRSSVLWPTPGNHEGHTADSATQSGPYFDIFTLPRAGEAGGIASGTEAYYAFDYGNMHLISLESYELNHAPGSPEMTWLAEDVQSTGKEWVIAFWHHPPYSKGSHDSDAESDLREMRESALPILEAAGVDLVLTGHSHSYERSFLVDGHYGDSTTLTSSMILDGGNGRIGEDGAYIKQGSGPQPHQGAVYVVAGNGGSVSSAPLDHPVMVVSLATLGSVVMDVNGPQLDLRMIDSTGVVRDSFTLYKGPLTPPAARFTAQPVAGPSPLRVDFKDVSTGPVTLRSWDFEDDGVADSAEAAPGHQFTQPGLYDVRLRVTGASGTGETVQHAAVCVLPSDPAAGADTDADGVADAADNCVCAPNPDQQDVDRDGTGDTCDAVINDDGVMGILTCDGLRLPQPRRLDPGDSLRLGGGGLLEWDPAPDSLASNVYRGVVPYGGRFGYGHACLLPWVTGASATDPKSPPAGALYYYLVSGRGACDESSAGHASDGQPIPTPERCP